MPRHRLSPEAKDRQLRGSRRGAELVRSEFDSAITRNRYCELVGIHPTTLRKWEKLHVVRPELASILNSPTRVFSREDVAFGKRLIAMLRRRPGEISIEHAAATLRQQRGGASGRGTAGTAGTD